MAPVGIKFNRLSHHPLDPAHYRSLADLAYLAEIVHTRGVLCSPDLCSSSGERRLGCVDLAVQRHVGNVVLPAIDILLSKIRDPLVPYFLSLFTVIRPLRLRRPV